MEHENRRDLVVTGTTTAAGGIYRNVKITGEGAIEGDVDCISLRCVGTSVISGGLKANRVHLVGTFGITENVDADSIRMKGQLDIEGRASMKEAKIHGKVSAKENVSGEELYVRGFLKAGQNCQAEKMYVKGAFAVGGLLNVGELKVRLNWGCEAKEIGGGTIEVRNGGAISRLLQPFLMNHAGAYGSTLSAELIEGDDIYLERTFAKLVRGNRITIGPGCEIEQVEYRIAFHKHKKSSVKESRQI